MTITPTKPSCFKAYDVRGRIDTELDATIARRIGSAYAQVMKPKSVVIGYDCRQTSPQFRDAVAQGLLDAGVDVLDIGQAGTEEVYFATSHLRADGGIEVTASHNPIDYNGMKFVGPESRPLSEEEFQSVAVAAGMPTAKPTGAAGEHRQTNVRASYAQHLLSQVDVAQIPPLKLVVNAGNGVAGPAFDAIAQVLHANGSQIEVCRIHHNPDGSFPNGIPNPLLPENRAETSSAVLREQADIGIAWDGDFDRCFLFDDQGRFVDGEYLVGLLASAFLHDAPGATIVHDPRVIWNTQDQVARHGGIARQSKTGHAHIKRIMRATNAIYGGEMSAHHYFRDFMYCDSGMLPWLKVIELMGRTGKTLAELVARMQADFPSSGEINFVLRDPKASITGVRAMFEDSAAEVSEFDGLSMAFDEWRFNLRSSSTEPVVRLNVETRGNAKLLAEKTALLQKLLTDA